MRFLLFITLSVLFTCCKEGSGDGVHNLTGEDPLPGEHNITTDEVEGIMEDANTRLWQEEDHLINMYVQNQGLDVIQSGTGLRYQVYVQGDGPEVTEGLFVLVDFTITLLNGDTCYTSMGARPEEFLVAMDAVESGLHDAFRVKLWEI